MKLAGILLLYAWAVWTCEGIETYYIQRENKDYSVVRCLHCCTGGYPDSLFRVLLIVYI